MRGGRAAITFSAALTASSLLALAPAARAQSTVKACAAFAEDAQRLRADGRLLEAREKLNACSVDLCPQVVRIDCATWASEIDRATPTIIVDAKNASGADIAEAKVFVDNRQVADRIDGRPIAVNPGSRVVRVDLPNGESAVATIVAKENAKGRAISIVIGAPKSPPSGEPKNDGAWGWGQYTGVALVGVGAALVTYALVEYLSYRSDKSDLEDKFHAADTAAAGCPAISPPSSTCGKNVATREMLRTQYDANEVDAKSKTPLMLAAGIGGALLVTGGVVLFVIGPRGSSSTSNVRGGPVITPSFAGMTLGGAF